MRALLDTHVALELLRQGLGKRYPDMARCLAEPTTIGSVSVASLWEIAIKTRLGKLDPGMALEDIAGYFVALRLSILPIQTRHVIVAVHPEPQTRDPFDRLLLAQCQIEGLSLVTVDRALVNHRLALKI
ncbi:MAG TPA: type II toxin-antitoxin system VapC family toxin [Vineibacter sp.]|nr:type II toxin-antitoxin system VapC family toxin [Vineibacter sp.]